jgi:hypothetical protein
LRNIKERYYIVYTLTTISIYHINRFFVNKNKKNNHPVNSDGQTTAGQYHSKGLIFHYLGALWAFGHKKSRRHYRKLFAVFAALHNPPLLSLAKEFPKMDFSRIKI